MPRGKARQKRRDRDEAEAVGLTSMPMEGQGCILVGPRLPIGETSASRRTSRT